MKKNKEYTVYRHVAPNNKIYVGVTCLPPHQRWQNGRGYKTNQYFSHAIKKYGWDNFKHEILFTNLTPQQASRIEKILIACWRCNDSRYGYNIESGGISNYQISDTTRRKMSLAHKNKMTGKDNPMYGRNLSEDAKRKISIANKNKVVSKETRLKMSMAQRGEKHPMYGKHHSEESKLKMSISTQGENNPNYGKHLYGALNPMYGKHHTEKSKKLMSEKQNKNKKSVCMIDKDSNSIIHTFESIRKAALETGIAHQHISSCCHGKSKTAGGYKWCFINGVPNLDSD